MKITKEELAPNTNPITSMRNKKTLGFSILMAMLLCIMLFSCKKNDSAYYNYENDLKEFDGNALEYLKAQQSGVYDSLLLVLNRLPSLQDSLKNQKVTFFAVTNRSFQTSVESLNAVRKRTNKAPLYLANIDVKQLDTMVSKYIIRGEFNTSYFQDYADGLIVKSIAHNYNMHVLYKKADASGFKAGGPAVITFTDPKNSIFVRYWERTPTNSVNIKTKNAIINVLSPGHDFGFGEFVTRVNN